MPLGISAARLYGLLTNPIGRGVNMQLLYRQAEGPQHVRLEILFRLRDMLGLS